MDVSARTEDGVTVAVLQGEFDAHHSDGVLEELAKVEPGPGGLVLDMSGVSFLDSAGISALIRLREQNPEGTVSITNPSTPVKRVLGIVGLLEIFGLDPA
ncbi:MAG: STAS domain-containing protein [Acidimicrobiales bacterium]